jgi:hypothetical protein
VLEFTVRSNGLGLVQPGEFIGSQVEVVGSVVPLPSGFRFQPKQLRDRP